MRINPSKTINELISALSFALDIEENKKIYHAWRVSVVSAYLSKSLFPQKRKEIFYAALLHDIGGVGLPHHIIHYFKKEPYKEPILLSHPLVGAQLVSIIPKMTESAKYILDHHEFFNGKGYPQGKQGEKIPLGAQIIRIADSIDIAIQNKIYHQKKKLAFKLLHLSNKEVAGYICESAIKLIKNKNIFQKILARRNIPRLFQKTRKKVGKIFIKLGIDAIGITLEVFAQIIDMKHPYTWGHSTRVSRYALSIALAMNLDHDEITRIRWAGLIHDIGKLSIPRRILDKPKGLTPQEFKQIKRHPQFTSKIIKMITTLKEIAPIASGHHERYNGKGYPKGLKKDKIPLGARILAVCDAFDAMTSQRPYRRILSIEQACREIAKNAYTQFDPEVVKVAIPLFKGLAI